MELYIKMDVIPWSLILLLTLMKVGEYQ